MRALLLVTLVAVLVIFSIQVFAQADYTGQATNIRQNERGIAFTVVIRDGSNNEVLRRDQWVSASTYQPEKLSDAIKNVVDRMTQEMYAHTENSKDFIASYKTGVESYTARCGTFVPVDDRPNPQDNRP